MRGLVNPVLSRTTGTTVSMTYDCPCLLQHIVASRCKSTVHVANLRSLRFKGTLQVFDWCIWSHFCAHICLLPIKARHGLAEFILSTPLCSRRHNIPALCLNPDTCMHFVSYGQRRTCI